MMIMKSLLVSALGVVMMPCPGGTLQPDGTVTSGGAAVPISESAVDATLRQLDGILDAGLRRCQTVAGQAMFPATACGTKRLGDGFACPTTSAPQDLPSLPACTYSASLKVGTNTPGLEGKLSILVEVSTAVVANKRVRHDHSKRAELATKCADQVVTWYAEVEQTTTATSQLSTELGVLKGNLELGTRGTRTGLGYCLVEPHDPASEDGRKCGP